MPADPIDPFDVDSLRQLAPNLDDVEQIVVSIPVRKPGRSEFFRVNPDPEYTLDWHVYIDEDDQEHYWIAPNLTGAIGSLLKSVRVFTCASKHGGTFLWPAKLPSGTAGASWSLSALNGAEMAMKRWVRLESDRANKAYSVLAAQGDLGEPTWPDMTLPELLRLAFAGDRTVNHPDHPILRKLRGDL